MGHEGSIAFHEIGAVPMDIGIGGAEIGREAGLEVALGRLGRYICQGERFRLDEGLDRIDFGRVATANPPADQAKHHHFIVAEIAHMDH